MALKQFNVNQYAYVKITREGWAHLAKNFDEDYINHCILSRAVEANGEIWHKIQLWKVFDLLPSDMLNTFFEPNVLIDEADLTNAEKTQTTIGVISINRQDFESHVEETYKALPPDKTFSPDCHLEVITVTSSNEGFKKYWPIYDSRPLIGIRFDRVEATYNARLQGLDKDKEMMRLVEFRTNPEKYFSK